MCGEDQIAHPRCASVGLAARIGVAMVRCLAVGFVRHGGGAVQLTPGAYVLDAAATASAAIAGAALIVAITSAVLTFAAFRRQREGNYPELTVTGHPVGVAGDFEGSVNYVSGTLPAREVEVLVRCQGGPQAGTTLGAYWHVKFDAIGVLVPNLPFRISPCSLSEAQAVPLPDVPFVRGTKDDAAVGVTWLGPDKRRRWWGRRYTFRDHEWLHNGVPVQGRE